MKKVFVFYLMLALTFAMVPAYAEISDEKGSEFETVLLKKGTLIIKEFIDYGKIEGMDFQTACVIDVETGEKFYALRIEDFYYNSKYDSGTTVGIMDADEIDGAVATLEYVKAHIYELKDYSEIIYKASSGMEVGAYYSNDGAKVFIKISSDATNFFELEKIDTLIAAFRGVQKTFGQ